ncbi:MAG: type IX secretion system protein PorQ [Ignavibacteriales bacterium]|nr:type IX secretion system protein PorQ [Ignavibacteriales bacterium]
MKKYRCISLVLILILFTGKIFSQNTFEFLRMDMSPRAAALAGSFVSNSDDPNVMFYNPAGINSLEGMPVSFSFVKHLLDINLASLALSREIEGLGRFSAGIEYISYGSFQGYTEDAVKTNEFGAGEVAFVLGYGNKLDENFYYGANAKFIYSGIEKYYSTAIGVDVGLQYIIPNQLLNFGFSILNIGSQLTSYINAKENLPLDIRVGVSKRLERLPVRLYLSINRLNDDQDKFFDRFKAFTIGTEFNLSKVLRLRLGFDNEKRKDLKIGTTAGLAGFHVGVGAVISGYNFDYSYSSLGPVGSLNRVGITTVF